MILVYTTLSAQRSHPGRAHILSGITLLDGAPAQRRVVVMDRTTGGYIISTVTGDSGVFAFTYMPQQILRKPYCVICFDDRENEYGNAMIFDRVYQVDDDGNPPQT